MRWLRSKGVATKTPFHTLRKEFGSLLNQRHGVFVASVGLRHASVEVTTMHYTDTRPRATIGLGGLLGDKVTLAEFKSDRARTK